VSNPSPARTCATGLAHYPLALGRLRAGLAPGQGRRSNPSDQHEGCGAAEAGERDAERRCQSPTFRCRSGKRRTAGDKQIIEVSAPNAAARSETGT